MRKGLFPASAINYLFILNGLGYFSFYILFFEEIGTNSQFADIRETQQVTHNTFPNQLSTNHPR